MGKRENARGRSALNDKGRRYSRREMLRLGVIGAGVIGASPLLVANSSSASTGSATQRRSGGTKPKLGGTLNFGRQTGPTQLDPANSIVEGDVYTLDKIFEPLYITSPEGTLTPWLAQGHTVSSDGKTWTFSLRPGVKFSDGKPVTVEDVVFSIHRAADRRRWPSQLLGLRDQVLQGDRLAYRHLRAFPAWASLCRTSRCSPIRSCRPTSAARASPHSSPIRSAQDLSCSSRSSRVGTRC